jgi:hypothetical protein
MLVPEVNRRNTAPLSMPSMTRSVQPSEQVISVVATNASFARSYTVTVAVSSRWVANTTCGRTASAFAVGCQPRPASDRLLIGFERPSCPSS